MRLNLLAPRTKIEISFVSRTMVVWIVAVILLPLVSLARGPKEMDTVKRVRMGNGMFAAIGGDRQLFLEAEPLRGEGWIRFANRLCNSGDVAKVIADANGGSRRLRTGIRYKVPFNLLASDFQRMVVEALFLDDKAEPEGWRHRVQVSSVHGSESLWQVADWFTGQGQNYRAIREDNQLSDDELVPGQTILIPAHLLRPAFRSMLPEQSSYHLQYGTDEEGEFAIYRLKPGEALYSSVIIRFTGVVFSDDVNELASQVAKRSGIRDVTDIEIGYEVKIPFEILRPEYLPLGNKRRAEYESGRAASAQFSNQVRANRLQGVTVILDSGHGGSDVGASVGGVWESTYVYDIMSRVQQSLSRSTSATVIATTRDGNQDAIPDRDRLPNSKSHRVLTTPNYKIEDSRVGVHLRWYLANSIYRQAVSRGSDPAKIVFVSIHADSLHPSLRGAMAYIPGAEYRAGSYGKSGSVYASRQEVRENPRVSYSSRERVESEGLSRDLAGHILASFGDRNLAIHPDKPIREKIIRSRRAWVPAVLRYNAVPSKVLVEVCNLANQDDRQLIQTQVFRQKVADAITDGILAYYGQAEGATDLRVAATSP
ncbi:MAG: N-acetylmuramoyl-L-alanine amidase [Acidobacteriota bacterium]